MKLKQIFINLSLILACILTLCTSQPIFAESTIESEKYENYLYIDPHKAVLYYQNIFEATSADKDLSLWLQTAVKLNSSYFHIGDLSLVPNVLAKVMDKAAQSNERATYAHLLLQQHIILANKGDKAESRALLEQAFKEAKASGAGQIIALVHIYLAKEEHYQANNYKAIELLHQATITLKDSPHDARYYAMLNNIAALFIDFDGQLSESLKIYAEITEYFDRHGLHFLGAIAYENYANFLIKSDQLEAAVQSFKKSVQHASAIKDEYGIASAAMGMGHVYHKQNLYRQALEQFRLARKMFLKFNDPSVLSKLDTSMALSYLALNQADEAWAAIAKWKSYFETSSSPDSRASFLEAEAQTLENLDRSAEAIQSYKNLTSLQRNIFDSKRQELANRYYAEFEVGRRNQENLKLEHQNRLQSVQIENQSKVATSTRIALVAAVTALTILGFSFYRALLSRRKIESLNRYIETNVLQRFLPPELVQEILAGKSRLDDRTKTETVTVLFADLCQFTRATDRLGPETISHILNDFFINMTEVIFSERGTIDKFIGDAIMVIFGAPTSLAPAEQALAAVRCARKMQEKLQELNKSWELSEGQHFEMRIGIHQGQAVVGTFGGAKRSDYTVVGTSVNIAARVEGIADPNSILVTDAITQFLDPREFSLRGQYRLRGLDMEIPLFRIEEQQVSSTEKSFEKAS